MPLFHRQYQLNSPRLGSRQVAFPSKQVPLQCGRVVENNFFNMGGSSIGFNFLIPGDGIPRKSESDPDYFLITGKG